MNRAMAESPAHPKPKVTFRDLSLLLMLPVLAAFSSVTLRLSLTPVFGSIPAWRHSLIHFLATAISASIFGSLSRSLPTKLLSNCLSVHAFYIPILSHYLLLPLISHIGPEWGPLFLSLPTDLPLVFCSFYILADSSLVLLARKPRSRAVFLLASCCAVSILSFSLLQKHLVPSLGQAVFLTRAGLQICSALGFALAYPSRLVVLTLPALVFITLLDNHLPFEAPTARLNATLRRHGYTLLDRQESLTGYISVLENTVDRLRVLRCDHSLLGGQWLATPDRLIDGIVVPEPVYTAFTMLESVRLMTHTEPSRRLHASHSISALNM